MYVLLCVYVYVCVCVCGGGGGGRLTHTVPPKAAALSNGFLLPTSVLAPSHWKDIYYICGSRKNLLSKSYFM